MSEAYLLVAQGYEMVAAGLRQLAEAGGKMPEVPVPAEKAEMVLDGILIGVATA